MSSTLLTIRLPAWLRTKLRVVAAATRRTEAQIIRDACREYAQTHERDTEKEGNA